MSRDPTGEWINDSRIFQKLRHGLAIAITTVRIEIGVCHENKRAVGAIEDRLPKPQLVTIAPPVPVLGTIKDRWTCMPDEQGDPIRLLAPRHNDRNAPVPA